MEIVHPSAVGTTFRQHNASVIRWNFTFGSSHMEPGHLKGQCLRPPGLRASTHASALLQRVDRYLSGCICTLAASLLLAPTGQHGCIISNLVKDGMDREGSSVRITHQISELEARQVVGWVVLRLPPVETTSASRAHLALTAKTLFSTSLCHTKY